ncbi:MAG: hypothetical protein EA367_17450 [Leptolyngbya sp. DLM2.Bin15]|nr:MAG: hypothetical protein EA367_17450 [Leptolyngbya sp. DLM2.Bin15]
MQTPVPFRRIQAALLTAAVSIGLGSALVGLASGSSQASDVVPSQTLTQAGEAIVADGVYLYGQSSEPEQVGSAYMVFESRSDRLVGAFYMPHSSFDCFYGSAEPDQLALMVVDSYEQGIHSFDVALQSNSNVASSVGGAIAPIALEGFQPVATLSENDYRILEVCQSQYGDQI